MIFGKLRSEKGQLTFKVEVMDEQRKQRSNRQHLLGHRKSKGIAKKSTSASLTTLKPLTVWIKTSCEIFLKRREYQTTLPASWDTCMPVKKQQLKMDMEQRTGSKLGKKYFKAVHCHPAYLTYIQSTSYEMLNWMN